MNSESLYQQINLFDFNQPWGLWLDMNNRWVKLAKKTPWDKIKDIYKEHKEEMAAARKAAEATSIGIKGKKDKQIQETIEGQLSLPFIDQECRANQIAHEEKVIAEAGSKGGHPSLGSRIEVGSLIIQGILETDDRETTSQIGENPYLQYFLGYPGYSPANTFTPSCLSNFRARIPSDAWDEINEAIIQAKHDYSEMKAGKQDPAIDTAADQAPAPALQQSADNAEGCGENHSSVETPVEQVSAETATDKTVPSSEAAPASPIAEEAHAKAPDEKTGSESAGSTEQKDSSGSAGESCTANSGTVIMDATCAPVYIRFPQDFSLTNEARADADRIIDRICEDNNLKRPRTYRRKLQKVSQDLSKCKKKTKEKIRAAMNPLLNGVHRNLNCIESLLKDGYHLTYDESVRVKTIEMVYAQQKYMYDNDVRRVPDRVVSIEMPFIRPISRGKTPQPTEFGPKFDISVDEEHNVRVEHFSYSAYNEGGNLQEVVESYRQRHGHYPERVLADQIYRTKENRDFCKKHGIRLSGPKLGRPSKNEEKAAAEKKVEVQDLTDRIEVERHFSRQKRVFGLFQVREKTADRVQSAVSLAAVLDNLVPTGF